MTPKEARAFARNASVYACQPGDRIVGPTGQEMYREPLIVAWGWRAVALMWKGSPIGVVVFRPGEPTSLRYCDHEGRVHEERIEPSGEEAEMKFAMLRMAEIVKHFLGERHPLAEAASANAVPA